MSHDIIVIGAGAAGLNIAVFMNKVGFKVLLIDRNDETIGGDCLNFGCVPSKALIHIARKVHDARHTGYGLKTNGHVDLSKVMDYVKQKQEAIREHENVEWFRRQGIDVKLGEATFVNKSTVRVSGREYNAKKIVIATGSKPRKLELPGVDKVKNQTNETIFSMKKLPKKLLVIGGGPIGIELGQAFGMLGSRVTILERSGQFLPKESKEITDVLYEQMQKQGIKVLFNTQPIEFTAKNKLLIKHEEHEQEMVFDELLVSIGRIVDIDPLKLQAAGVEVNNGRIVVDDYLRTSQKNILVCGDAAGSYQFTHAAELHARLIIGNFFSPIKKKINYGHLNWVTYTSPEIATFGLNEKQLQDRGIQYERTITGFDEDRAIVDEYEYGILILYISNNMLLGGSMVAPNAGELFQELVLANTLDLDVGKVFTKTYAYPTATRINKKALGYLMSKKLTPLVKKFFRLMY